MRHDKNETRLDLHYLNGLIAVPFVITTGMHTRTDMIEAIYSLKIPVTKLHYHRTFCFLLQAEQTTIESTLRETNAFLSLGFSLITSIHKIAKDSIHKTTQGWPNRFHFLLNYYLLLLLFCFYSSFVFLVVEFLYPNVFLPIQSQLIRIKPLHQSLTASRIIGNNHRILSIPLV